MSLVLQKKGFKVQGWFWSSGLVLEFRVCVEVQGSFHVPGFQQFQGLTWKFRAQGSAGSSRVGCSRLEFRDWGDVQG